MRIAICDDNKLELSQIYDVVKNTINKLNIPSKIDLFHNGLDILQSKISYDVLLLDIEMQNINGISLAQEIRKYNKRCIIIFISNYSVYLQDGYKVHAERYFMKPLNSLEFETEFKEIFKDYIIDSKSIFDTRIANHKIFLRDIIYIEFFHRKTVVHTTTASYSTTLTLKEWLNLLENCYFSQCHKGFIVNLKHVDTVFKNNVLLSNSEELLLTRTYKDSFIDDYHQYLSTRI